MTRLQQALGRSPVVAILRGITPDEVEAVADALVEEGVALIEVPLNSPDPFESIGRLVRRLEPDVLVGAGTVLRADDVDRLSDLGASLIISPNTNPEVIRRAAAAGMIALPGYATPSEAFTAIDAGASGLKLFPAEAASPDVLKAHRAVLPRDVPILVVGGVTPDTLHRWRPLSDGFGLGSALYKPGSTADEVRHRIRAFNASLVGHAD